MEGIMYIMLSLLLYGGSYAWVGYSIKLFVNDTFILFVLPLNCGYISGRYVCVYKDLNDACLLS